MSNCTCTVSHPGSCNLPNVSDNVESLSKRAGRFEYQYLVTHHFNKIRARLYNVAETNGNDMQANALKGLMKDFTDDAHHKLTNELDEWAITQGVIKEEDLMPHSVLSSRDSE